MRKALVILAAGLFLAGCTKEYTISDFPFNIDLPTIEFNQAYVDIIPETNDFYYHVGCLTVSEFNAYGSVENAIKAIDAALKKEYEEYKERYDLRSSFTEAMLMKGAWNRVFPGLQPKNNYILIAYAYDDNENPLSKTGTKNFTTAENVSSDISFSVSLDGDALKITPSNNDQYIFEMETKEWIDEYYAGSPELFFYYYYMFYAEYGFMDTICMRGELYGDLLEKLSVKPGEKFYIVAAGYNKGINSKEYAFEVTYNGPGQPGKVVPVNFSSSQE